MSQENRDILYHVTEGGLNPLLLAADDGLVEFIKTLVEAGADVNYTGSMPLRGLILGASFGNFPKNCMFVFHTPLRSDQVLVR